MYIPQGAVPRRFATPIVQHPSPHYHSGGNSRAGANTEGSSSADTFTASDRVPPEDFTTLKRIPQNILTANRGDQEARNRYLQILVRRYAVEAEKELNADYTQRLEDYEARKQAWVASQRSERRFTDANPKPKPPNSRDIIRRLQENAKQEPTTQRPTDGGWRGASKALRLLVEENEGLVKHVVSKAVKSYDQAWLNSRGLTNEELLSVARGKMLEALVRNDIEQYKTAFSTYPMICMKPSVSSYIQDRSANLALGAKRSVIKAALGPDSNLSAAEKKELAARVSPYVPLSKKHPEQNVMGPLTQRQLEVQEKLPQSLQQWLNNSDPVLPEDVVQQRQLREALERAITTKQEEVQKYPSNVKALEVLKRRYLDGLPLKEIAAQMGLKEGYASELSKIGLRLLRRAARNQRLLEFKGHLS